MKRIAHNSLLWLACLSLCACAGLPFFSNESGTATNEPAEYRGHLLALESVHAFALTGRIGVITEKKGFSGSMLWHHNGEGDDISFYSPFGAKIGELSAGPSGVTLVTSDQKTYSAGDAETLTQNVLGWSLPLSGLPDWALGRPAAGEAQVQAWYDGGLIARMQQEGWNIEYQSYRESSGLRLPGKIVLKSPRLDLKLVVESWQTDGNASGGAR
ncbi:MAG TPA: lipoprotein insertase outer membrane protein LolB [Methylophilaceae bacterium]|nr:lipoprotein insertase outer membrane protein LolB [Methylophilaceae bacterium]